MAKKHEGLFEDQIDPPLVLEHVGHLVDKVGAERQRSLGKIVDVRPGGDWAAGVEVDVPIGGHRNAGGLEEDGLPA